MSGEQLGAEEHEGERYLRMLGLEHLADREVTAADKTFAARDFLDICGQHARPLLVGLEAMSPDDPRHEATKNALRDLIGRYVGLDEPS